jgi:hypothetical protein
MEENSSAAVTAALPSYFSGFYAIEIIDSFLKGPKWSSAFHDFVDIRCASYVDDEAKDASGTSFSHRQWDTFLEYRSLFEKILSDRLGELQLTPEAFVQICENRIAASSYPDETLLSILETVPELSHLSASHYLLS